MRVVVADDEPGVRDVVGRWLGQLGHAVTPVDGGAALLAACRATDQDLVVSDVQMLPPDGLATAAVLRGELNLPVVLMSGSWEADQAARADALGAVRLAKPIRPLELARAIAEAVSARGRSPGSAADAGDALFRQLVETAEAVAIFTLDLGGRVTHWNTGAVRLFGYAPAEVLGASWEALFTPDDRAAGRPDQEMTTAAADGRAVDERWHVRKDGTEFWAIGDLTALRGPAGRLLCSGMGRSFATGPT